MQQVRKSMKEVYQEALSFVQNSAESDLPQDLSAKSSISGDCDWDEDEGCLEKSVLPVKVFHLKTTLDSKSFQIGTENMEVLRKKLENMGKIQHISKTHHTRNYSSQNDFAEDSFLQSQYKNLTKMKKKYISTSVYKSPSKVNRRYNILKM